MPRIHPLSWKQDTYINDDSGGLDEQVPDGHNAVTFGYEQAIKRGRQEKSVYKFLKEGGQNVLDMWMGVAPIVMAFGLIDLIFAESTPLFVWIRFPLVPLLELMHIPDSTTAY